VKTDLVGALLKQILKIFWYFWAAPNSLIGLTLGVAGLLTSGQVQVRNGCLVFFGGAVSWFHGFLLDSEVEG
jgi:hypothetical protein